MSSYETFMAVWIFLILRISVKRPVSFITRAVYFSVQPLWTPYSSLRGNWGNRFDKFRNHPNDISFSRWVDFDTSPFLKSSKIPMGQIYRGPLYTLPNLNCISCIHCPVFLFYNSLWLLYIHRVKKAQSNHGGPYPKTGQMGKWSLRQNFINILPVLY